VSALVGKGHLPKEERLFVDSGERFDHIRNTIAKWAGAGKVGFNNPMFLALKRRALRAVALSHYLKGMQCYPERTSPDDNAYLYYQAMCMEMSVSQLAVIAGTLANTGVCPLTQEACLHPAVTKSTLSLLYSCGLNAYGGKWDFNIGVPATCGSSGCLMVVMPGVMGMVVQNRALNEYNVPLRGLVLSALLTARFRLNLFDQLVYGDEDIAIAPAQRPQHKAQLDVSSTVLFFELCTAAAGGDVRKVLLLLRWGASVTQVDYDQRTALHIACSDGHADVAKVLILRGAFLNCRDRWGITPIEDARRAGLWSTIRLMEQVESGQVKLQVRRNPLTGAVEHVTPLTQALQTPRMNSGPWDMVREHGGMAAVVQQAQALK
jgi:glutaminase